MRNFRFTPTPVLVLAFLALACADRDAPTVPEGTAAAPSDAASPTAHDAAVGANFRTHLVGAEEVPSVETRAQGQAVFQLSADGTELRYRLIASNIVDVLMAHIHLAPEGSNGPVVAWLYPAAPPPQLIEGRFSGVLATGVVTADDLVGPLAGSSMEDLVEEIRAGNTYVNVHTQAHPGGEIRGQID